MAASTWQEHDGVPYLYFDQRSLSPDDYAESVLAAWRMREERPGPVIVLADVRGVAYMPPPDLRAEIKRLMNSSAGRVPSAVVTVGLEGLPAVFARGLTFVGGGMRIVPARSWEQALSLVAREARRLGVNRTG